MGEVADMMLDGTLCSVCGEFIGSDAGFPQSCSSCSAEPAPASAHSKLSAKQRKRRNRKTALRRKRKRAAGKDGAR